MKTGEFDLELWIEMQLSSVVASIRVQQSRIAFSYGLVFACQSRAAALRLFTIDPAKLPRRTRKVPDQTVWNLRQSTFRCIPQQRYLGQLCDAFRVHAAAPESFNRKRALA